VSGRPVGGPAEKGRAHSCTVAGCRYSPPPFLTRPALAAGAAMAKPKKKKEIVFLVCEETGDRNYTIMKKPGTNKLELKKYSPRVRKHTKHVEKKK
jgi:large subunit ribosomal protein L33